MKIPIKVGIIGGGENSAIGSVHLASLRMDSKYEIGPCYFSTLEEENKKSHKFYSLPWYGHYNDIDSWLNKYANSIDLIIILTPSTDHASHIIKIAQLGLSFVTEKPICCSLNELESIKNCLENNKNISARFVHNYSGYPMYREMVLRIKKKEIGNIHHVRVQMPSDGYAREEITGRPQLWRQKDPYIPMIMLDLGTHLHHLVSMAIGHSNSRIKSRMHQMVNKMGVIDNVEIWEERSDNITVTYWMSKAHLGLKNGLNIEVYGENGGFIWNQMDPDYLIKSDMESNNLKINRGSISNEASLRDRFKAGHPTGFIDAFSYFYSDMADDIIAEKDGLNRSLWIKPIKNAFIAIEFLAAAKESYLKDKWVNLTLMS